MSQSFTIRGLDVLLRGMAQSGRIIEEEVRDAFSEEVQDIVTDLSDYPRERPGQTYERTGDLGLGWQAAPTWVSQGGGIGVRVTNDTPYVAWVQSAAMQAAWHRGRWPTVEEVLEDHQDSINNAGTKALERTAERMARGG